MDPHSRAQKKNTSHGNEVLPHDTTLSYKDRITDEQVRAEIQQAIGPHEDVLTIVKRRKLQSQRAAENRRKWRKLVVKSSVVPQRPSWFRDR